MFIGHTDRITQVMFNATNSHLITVGEALFCWSVQSLPSAELTHPRHTPPLPSTYNPINVHTTSFLTPCGKGDHKSSDVHDNSSESDTSSSSSDHVSSSDDESHSNDIIIDHVSTQYCIIMLC